jgi:hypothetical protein
MTVSWEEMLRRVDNLKAMEHALDELAEGVRVLLNEYEHAMSEQVEPWWPNEQSDALRRVISNWSIWIPELRAIDHLSNKESNESEGVQQ